MYCMSKGLIWQNTKLQRTTCCCCRYWPQFIYWTLLNTLIWCNWELSARPRHWIVYLRSKLGSCLRMTSIFSKLLEVDHITGEVAWGIRLRLRNTAPCMTSKAKQKCSRRSNLILSPRWKCVSASEHMRLEIVASISRVIEAEQSFFSFSFMEDKSSQKHGTARCCVQHFLKDSHLNVFLVAVIELRNILIL